jgi:hypothetical protein
LIPPRLLDDRIPTYKAVGLLGLLETVDFFYEPLAGRPPVMKRTKAIMEINRLKWTKKTMVH